MIHKLNNPIELCNLKFASDSGGFEGIASVFDGNDAVNDTITKGAFTKTLSGRTRAPLMLFQHDPSRVIGKWVNLAESDEGLVAKGEFTPGHSLATDIHALTKHGAIDGLSIGFRIPNGGFEKKDDGGRIIKEIDLVEISIVSFPADSQARISVVKEEILTIENLKDAELFLRDSGVFSKSTATAFVSRLRELARRDADAGLIEEITKLQALHNQKQVTKSLLDVINRL